VVRRFRSDEPPPRLHATPYFAELWRPDAPSLPGRLGHNRFVWDLRYPRPRAAEYDYSIAGVPGRPATLLPAGPFVLPGRYEVRLTVDSRTVRQPLTVAQDPRRHETLDELRELLALQRETIASLEAAADSAVEKERLDARLTRLAADPRARGASALVAQVRQDLDRMALPDERDEPHKLDQSLRALETDLEASDAPPTDPQRRLLAECRPRVASARDRLETLRRGPLARLDARLRALGVSEPPPPPAAEEESASEDVP
jgi:hypothetical protein